MAGGEIAKPSDRVPITTGQTTRAVGQPPIRMPPAMTPNIAAV